jgi:hypothetical protein
MMPPFLTQAGNGDACTASVTAAVTFASVPTPATQDPPAIREVEDSKPDEDEYATPPAHDRDDASQQTGKHKDRTPHDGQQLSAIDAQ